MDEEEKKPTALPNEQPNNVDVTAEEKTDFDTESEKPTPAETAEPTDDTTSGKTQSTEEMPVSSEKGLSRDELYLRAKERNIKKLEQEILEKNSRDTKKKRRNWWIKTIFLLIFIVISIVVMFGITHYITEDGITSFNSVVKNASPIFFAVFVLAVILYMILESSKFSYLLKISTGKFRLRTAMKTMYLGKYYDGITPLATGGQPFQIYYLHKKDIPAGVATAIPLVKFMVTTIVTCVAGIVLLALVPHLLGHTPARDALLIISWISLFINFLVPVGILFVSLFPRAGKKMIAWIVHVLSKLRIVRHKYPTMKKYITEVSEYRDALRLLIKHWWKLIPLILLCVLTTGVYVLLPFFATLALAGPSISNNLPLLALQMSCLTMVSYYSVSWVPTPGNSGALEASSALAFSTLKVAGGTLGWMVLVWRFGIFYVFILSGIGITIFEIARSAYRNHRAKKREEKTLAQAKKHPPLDKQ